MSMAKKKLEDIAEFIGEVIENGYNTEKSLDHLQTKYKLNDIQISNLEELIVNWKYLDEGDWEDFQETINDRLNIK